MNRKDLYEKIMSQKEIVLLPGDRIVCYNTTFHAGKECKPFDCTGLRKLTRGGRRTLAEEIQKEKVINFFHEKLQEGESVTKAIAATGYSASTIARWENELFQRKQAWNNKKKQKTVGRKPMTVNELLNAAKANFLIIKI